MVKSRHYQKSSNFELRKIYFTVSGLSR